MADRDRASARSVRLGYEDHEWLAKLAEDEAVSIHALAKRAVRHFRHWQEKGEQSLKEALDVFEAERSGHEEERRRRLYFQRQYELQSRRLRNRVRDERKLRAKYEKQLRDERKLRAERETQLRSERDYYERQARAAEAARNALFSATVAKLLTLAIRSESDAEAMTAVEKARILHRKEHSPMSDTP